MSSDASVSPPHSPQGDGRARRPRWTDVVKAILLPPAGLLWLAGLGLVLAHGRWAGAGLVLVDLGVTTLFLLSLPGVSHVLISFLDRYPALDPAGFDAAEPTALVVLDAGRRRGAREYRAGEYGAKEYGGDALRPMTLERLAYAAWLRRRLGLPIAVTGNGAGSLMATYLRELFDVPVRWIEPVSHNTQENARRTAALLRPEGISRVVLVTHFWHMPRAVAAFADTGLAVVAAPMDFSRRGRWQSGLLLFVPSMSALLRSYLAIHEGVGWLWYRWRYAATDP